MNFGQSARTTFRYMIALSAIYFLTGWQTASGQTFNDSRPADTSSPRATLLSFIEACNELHRQTREDQYFDRESESHRLLIRRILDCLDTSELPEFERLDTASQVAVCLKEILDRVELPAAEEVPGREESQTSDGDDGLSRWRIPGTRISVERIADGPRKHEFLFSSGSVGRAVEYYNDIQSLPYRTAQPATSPGLYRWYVSAPRDPTIGEIVAQLPEWCRNELLGATVWKWIGVVIASMVSAALIVLCFWAYRWSTRRIARQTQLLYWAALVFPILAVCIPLGLQRFAINQLALRGSPLLGITFLTDMTAILFSLVLIFGVTNRIAAATIASPKFSPYGLDAQCIQLLAKFIGILLSIIALLEGGRYLGIPITTLLASAGVGGLAIAFAAQDMLRTVFGTIMLLADRPFRVGDRIITDQYDGQVESIGLRSTKIRLLSGHQAVIPNGKLAGSDIENIGRRPHIRQTVKLYLPSDTGVQQVKQALSIVREVLDQHDGMDDDYPPKIFLREFKEDSLEIEFTYWYHPAQYWDALALGERLYLRIINDLESAGIAYGSPLITVRQKSDITATPEA